MFTTCRPRMARIGLLHRIRRECVNNTGVKSLHRVVLDRSARTRFDCLPGEAGTFIRFSTDGCAIHWMRTREVVSRLERRDVRKRPRETANRPLRLGIAFFGQEVDIVRERGSRPNNVLPRGGSLPAGHPPTKSYGEECTLARGQAIAGDHHVAADDDALTRSNCINSRQLLTMLRPTQSTGIRFVSSSSRLLT